MFRTNGPSTATYKYKGKTLYGVEEGKDGCQQGEDCISRSWSIRGRWKGRGADQARRISLEKYGDIHFRSACAYRRESRGRSSWSMATTYFVVYSASACWTDTYALGLLRLSPDGDPMDPAAWTKNEKPVFQRSPVNGVYATGHDSFFLSPMGQRTRSYVMRTAILMRDAGRADLRGRSRSAGTRIGRRIGQPVEQGVAIPVPSAAGVAPSVVVIKKN